MALSCAGPPPGQYRSLPGTWNTEYASPVLFCTTYSNNTWTENDSELLCHVSCSCARPFSCGGSDFWVLVSGSHVIGVGVLTQSHGRETKPMGLGGRSSAHRALSARQCQMSPPLLRARLTSASFGERRCGLDFPEVHVLYLFWGRRSTPKSSCNLSTPGQVHCFVAQQMEFEGRHCLMCSRPRVGEFSRRWLKNRNCMHRRVA